MALLSGPLQVVRTIIYRENSINDKTLYFLGTADLVLIGASAVIILYSLYSLPFVKSVYL